MSLLPASSIGDESTGFYSGVATQSLRLNDNSTQYLGRTPSSAGNTDTFTFSCWAKLSTNNTSLNWPFLSAGTGASNFTMLYIDGGSRRLAWYWYNGSTDYGKHYNAYLEDTGNFFHVVYAFDTTKSADDVADRVKVYINGVRVTSIAADYGWMGQNQDMHINAANEHMVGRYIGNNSYADGYLSDVNLIDGQALTPDSFGETKDGVWIPKAYSGSYGTNGFRLEFKNTTVGGTSPSSSTIGADTSGNNHHFNDYNVTTYDSNLPDCPENNFMTFNALHFADTTVPSTSNNLQYGATYFHADSDDGIFTTMEIPTSGKWYFELVLAHANKPTGAYFLGNAHKTRDDWTHVANYTSFNEGFAIQGSTNKVFEYGGSHIGSTHSNGTIYAFLIDVDNSTYDIYQNDTKIYDAGSFNHPGATEGVIFGVGNNSDSGTNNCNFYLNAGTDSSFAGQKTSGSSNESDANGVGDFYYSTKGGLALCSANLPTPTISSSSEHFNVNTWVGTGNGANAKTGIGFQPDWLWAKDRDNANNHILIDSVRGVTKYLQASQTAVEATDSNILQSFDSDGFTTVGQGINFLNVNYVGFNWKAGGDPADVTGNFIKDGVAFTPTQGTMDANIMSVNTTAGFAIVEFTSNVTSDVGETGTPTTVAHALGVKPQWVIIKDRDGGSYPHWNVWHQGYQPDQTYLNYQFIGLQNSNAANNAGWTRTDTGFTTNLFSTPRYAYTENGKSYIAYVFHEVEGYSKFGSYTGNGASGAGGQFVYTGFRPAWIMTKRADSSGNWYINDTARSPFNVTSVYGANLYADLANAESGNGMYILSNGFKLNNTDSSQNANGGSYVYMAFAEQPFKFSNAR